MIGMTLVLWLAIAAVMFEAHSKVTVGSDGVLIWRHFETHFVPFADIASVMEVDGVAIRMILHSGAVVDVYTAKEEQAMKPKYLRACESMLSRIRQGVERAQDQASVPTDGHEALRHAYRALRGGEPVRRVAYRAEPAPDPWQLLRIMENDGGAPAARAAAAVLARQHGDEEVRKRIRVAEQGTVNPKLKKLFRAAMSDAEPEVVEAALVEVEKGADGVSSQP
jgi:hypothetical protein